MERYYRQTLKGMPGSHDGSYELPNTGVSNTTHHRAIRMLCRMVDNLPIGMMLVGRHFHEALRYKLIPSFEQHLR